jgi:cyclopropane-fatty-acyl-phospholipid synthase
MIRSGTLNPFFIPGLRAPTPAPLLRGLTRLRRGSIEVTLPHGERHHFTGVEPGPAARLAISKPYALAKNLMLRGVEGFAESYLDGHWQADDLARLLYLLALNEDELSTLDQGSMLARLVDRMQHALRRNSVRGSRRNIAYHYDLGNDFYALWLDETMTYSAAALQSPQEDLADAQRRKYRRILERLAPRTGEHIIEIGCGWGGFAEQAARAGYRVTGITLSEEQLAWARDRVTRAGLSDRVELRLQDYRELREEFDHVVSIEMFEAVGEQYWPGYFETLRRCLRPGGRAALQVITIADELFSRYRRGSDFIQMYFFPCGMLPSIPVFRHHAARAGLAVREYETFGLGYADTLRRWDRRVKDAAHCIEALGFDERFLRMWQYYLAYCEAGFRTGHIDVMQTTLGHADL